MLSGETAPPSKSTTLSHAAQPQHNPYVGAIQNDVPTITTTTPNPSSKFPSTHRLNNVTQQDKAIPCQLSEHSQQPHQQRNQQAIQIGAVTSNQTEVDTDEVIKTATVEKTDPDPNLNPNPGTSTLVDSTATTTPPNSDSSPATAAAITAVVTTILQSDDNNTLSSIVVPPVESTTNTNINTNTNTISIEKEQSSQKDDADAETDKSLEKKKRIRLTVVQKVEILKRLERGECQCDLVTEYGCSKRALARLKQERAIFSNLHLTDADANRKSRHSVKNAMLESKLRQFLRLAKINGFSINNILIKKVAIKLRDNLLHDKNLPENEKSNLLSFQASVNWSKSFYKRYHHNQINKTQFNIDQFKSQLLHYDLDCIFFIEHFHFFYKSLPNDQQFYSNNKIHVLLTINILNKIQVSPTIVDYDHNHNMNYSTHNHNIHYLSNSYGWIDDTTFKNWFYCYFLPTIRRNTSKPCVLIVDNEWTSNTLDDLSDNYGQVKILPIPKQTLNNQNRNPMNLGILSIFRRSIRYSLLSKLIRIDDDSNLGKVMIKDFNVSEFSNILEQSWRAINETFVIKFWFESNLLPEAHINRLKQSHSVNAHTSEEQISLACCCTPEQMKNIRCLENLIISRKLIAVHDDQESNVQRKESNFQRASTLVLSLHESGRRGIEQWLDIENHSKSQKVLSLEMDRILSIYKSPIAMPRIPMKRSISTSNSNNDNNRIKRSRSDNTDKNNIENAQGVTLQTLPHLPYLMELLAPIQKIVDECDCGSAPLLLRNLKQELVQVKTSQENSSE